MRKVRKCRTCKHFVNGWCVLEVLDRYPEALEKGCPFYEEV